MIYRNWIIYTQQGVHIPLFVASMYKFSINHFSSLKKTEMNLEFYSSVLKNWQRSVITLKCEHDLLMMVYAYKLACIILRFFLFLAVRISVTQIEHTYIHLITFCILTYYLWVSIYWCVFYFSLGLNSNEKLQWTEYFMLK